MDARFENGSLNFSLHANSRVECDESLEKIRDMTAKLGAIRAGILEGETTIRGTYSVAKASVSSGLSSSLLAGFLGRGVNGAFNADKRARLAEEQAGLISECEEAKRTVDDLLEQLAAAKRTILSQEYYAPVPPVVPQGIVSGAAEKLFIESDGKALGPYSRSELLAMWFSGEITDSTQCCPEGSPHWITYGEIVKGDSPGV